MYKMVDLTGQKFGKLHVLEYAGSEKRKGVLWRCKCDCGNEHIASGMRLRRGGVKSCGCLTHGPSPNRTHNMTGTRIYGIWSSMKYRCHRKRGRDVANYKERCITVCDEWQKFEPFYEWSMKNGYADNLTIDRIDNDKGYSPDNCRWATYKQQARNKRSNAYLTVDGVTRLRKEWAEISGIPYATLCWRLKKGWSPHDAVTRPICIEKRPW